MARSKFWKSLLGGALMTACGAVMAGNPIVTDVFTADPATFVEGDTFYLYTTHDEAKPGEWLVMNDWLCYSTKDMKNWTKHGVIQHYTSFDWARGEAWATQVVKRHGKYWHYVTVVTKGPWQRAIGVAVSDSPTGPFRDAIGKPLVVDATTPSPYFGDDIDPTVLVDDDGTAWLALGNPVCHIAKLKDNMIELDGGFRTIQPPNYTEGPWLMKRNGIYYLIYVSHIRQGWPEKISYGTAKSIEGPWTWHGLLTGPAENSHGIHPAVSEFKGQWHFFYHNGVLNLPDGQKGSSERRSVCAEYLYFNPDGTIQPIVQTKEGLDLPPKTAEQVAAAFVPETRVQPGCSEPGVAFTETAIQSMFRTFEEKDADTWEGVSVFSTVSKLYVGAPECKTFRTDAWSESLGQTFRMDKTIVLDRISLYAGDGDGTSAEAPLRIALYDLGTGDPNAKDYQPGANLLGESVSLAYQPQSPGLVHLDFSAPKRIVLKKDHVYVFEIQGVKGSTPFGWRATFPGRNDCPNGAAYRDRVKMLDRKGNACDFAIAVFGTECGEQ